MSGRGVLSLLPNFLGKECLPDLFFPPGVGDCVQNLEGLIAENERPARRYLSHFLPPPQVRALPVALYNQKTPDQDIDFYLDPIEKGEKWGLISDAGLPCIADPGAKLVFRARQRGLCVSALSGPSSIFLALMLSGLPGQTFTFHGYLAKEPKLFGLDLKRIEKRRGTHIFMERSYQTDRVLHHLVGSLSQDTLLCIASELTQPSQRVLTFPVKVWKKMPLPNLHKKNVLFLFYRPHA